ncbi:MAG: putative sugar nucleotidyl transferase [Planctomycetota bacterium]|nr:putative sugar nucleotidyl transferase [Planctomycetota bacterium]
MPPAIALDDPQPLLAPLTDLRPTFDVRTGALTTLERWTRALDLDILALSVRPELADLAAEQHHKPVNRAPVSLPAAVLIFSGRAALPPEGLDALALGESIVEAGTGHLIAAMVSGADAARVLTEPGFLPALRAVRSIDSTPAAPALLSRPWHVRAFRDRAIAFDLDLLTEDLGEPIPPGVTRIGTHPVTIHVPAKLSPTVVLDTEQGPIWIGPRAIIRPGAILVGPCAIGAGTSILERTLIKPNTAIGPGCKVAGEVGGTIFQGLANKAHDGHLGDSYVGEFANLGAGTTNSNLLNTYTEVIAKAAPQASNERTGQTFLGAIIGDHVKFAINSRIMTGAVLHTGSMFATTAPVSGCVAPFTWATDAGHRAFRLDKFLEVARAVLARRNLELSPAMLARLTQLHSQPQNTSQA